MKEWQIRQEVYHRTHDVLDFHADGEEVIHKEEQLVELVAAYFIQPWPDQLLYPAKTYAVAVIYAVLISHYFGDDVLEALNCPSLLYNNDHHFVTYDQNPSVYDQIIQNVSAQSLLTSHLPQVRTTVEAFHQEFLIPQP